MANKKRRNRKLHQPSAPAGSLPPRPASAPEAGSPAPVAVAAPVRAATAPGAVTGPRRVIPQATTIDIDARVPFFAADLRRVAVTATIMVLLIVGGSFLLR